MRLNAGRFIRIHTLVGGRARAPTTVEQRAAAAARLTAPPQAAAPQAAKKLVELAFHAEDPRVSLAAITVLMDRLFGKPAQQISADIKTHDIGRLHLEALQSLQARREERLLEITTEGGNA